MKDRIEAGERVGFTERNKAELRQFDLPENRKALLTLSDRVFAESRRQAPTVASARRVRLAMAVEMLLATALRGANLTRLEADRHFSEVRRDGAAIRRVVIPATEMKGKSSHDIPLPERTRLMMDEYLTVYWPLLAPEGSLYLFPGRNGGLRDSAHFAQTIVAFILRETGLTMHLHLFRHLSVKLHQIHRPGDVETARRFLQHKSPKTTLTHYIENRTDDAFASYHSALNAERARGGSHNAARR